MFWTQAAGLTHLGRAQSSRMADLPTAPSSIRRRTSARRVVRTRDGRVRGGFVLATWLVERTSHSEPLRLTR